jgi:hypothetical protein
MLPRFTRILAVVVLSASSSPAETGAPREVQLSFDASAADLPQAEITASVDREIGRASIDHAAPGVPELRLEVGGPGELVLSYITPGEPPVRRVLRRPERPEDVAEIVGLAAATLVRNQEGEPSPTQDAPAGIPETAPAPALHPRPEDPGRKTVIPAPAATTRENFLGVAFGPDLTYVPTSDDVCGPQHSPHGILFSCNYTNGAPVVAPTGGHQGSIHGGLLTGTSRILLTYDRAFSEHVRGGVRLGVDFDPSPISYPPLHAELRVVQLFGTSGAGAFRPELFAGFGVARVTGHTPVDIEADPNRRLVRVDAYANLGWFFVSGGAGLVYQATRSFELDACLQVMGLFPGMGVALTPLLGARLGL